MLCRLRRGFLGGGRAEHLWESVGRILPTIDARVRPVLKFVQSAGIRYFLLSPGAQRT